MKNSKGSMASASPAPASNLKPGGSYTPPKPKPWTRPKSVSSNKQ